jgi:hypothetical protein
MNVLSDLLTQRNEARRKLAEIEAELEACCTALMIRAQRAQEKTVDTDGLPARVRKYLGETASAEGPGSLTPLQWGVRLGVQVLEAAGWKNDGKSFTERIGRDEFLARASLGTVSDREKLEKLLRGER